MRFCYVWLSFPKECSVQIKSETTGQWNWKQKSVRQTVILLKGLQQKIIFIVDLSVDYFLDQWKKVQVVVFFQSRTQRYSVLYNKIYREKGGKTFERLKTSFYDNSVFKTTVNINQLMKSLYIFYQSTNCCGKVWI